MAIYHLHVNIISRGKGQSAVAAASYRTSQKLYNHRLGVTHSGKGKKGLVYSEILAPENAPAWATDREQLWNQVESAEKRKDFQVAKEIQLGLPIELNLEQQIALIRQFTRKNLVDLGLVADTNLYSKKENSHASVMMTTRTIDASGFSAKKYRMLYLRSTLMKWRESWAEIANHHLSMAGYDIRIDHRSYADQEMDLQPQIDIGIAVYKPNPSDYERFEENQQIIKENGDHIIANPKVALDYLLQQQKVFGEDDVRKFARRQSINGPQFKNIFTAILNYLSKIGYRIGTGPIQRR